MKINAHLCLLLVLIIGLIMTLFWIQHLEYSKENYVPNLDINQFSYDVSYYGNNLFNKGDYQFSSLKYIIPELDVVDHQNAINLHANGKLNPENFRSTLPQ